MSKRILVVEEQEDLRAILRDFLSASGYTVIEAVDGAVSVAKAASERSDIVLKDIQLPLLDGYDATARSRPCLAWQRSQFIAVSSFAMKGDEEKARASGCDDYVTKPYSPVDLLRLVQRPITSTLKSTRLHSCIPTVWTWPPTHSAKPAVGDLYLRSKINLWGNDGGKSAFVLIPVVKVPSAPPGIGNGATEGGIIAPLSFSLPNNLTLLFNSQVAILKDTVGGGYHPGLANLVNLSDPIAKNVRSMQA